MSNMRMSKAVRKYKLKYVALVLFVLVGWLQQKYEKAADQEAYEAECREIAKNPMAIHCSTPTRPDIPLPPQG
ncbi:hypothetical protein [Pseudomonas sp. CFBP 13602]|uniref:hypothetical protein n=1 Tax=Pseudomonas sp. CFBP 13602 TaxID=2774039 RepID=UPI00177DB111|nr:hypothetical protein [Pseudomonas sp. CFBP 13602]MBD8829012.1 hypothetical protein [Pseudomonas sp. CFBP 13602]